MNIKVIVKKQNKQMTITRKVEYINGKPCVRLNGFRPYEIEFVKGVWIAKTE